MLDSIYVGLTGLMGFSKGLRVIANNTANINTPGYKGSNLQFEDLFYSNHNLAGGAGGQSYGQLGYGLNTAGTTLSFKQGDFRNTAEDLDVAVDGTGMFVLKDADGQISYTRAGQFVFNDAGVLVSKSNGDKVMALNGGNSLSEISIANSRTNAGTATTTVNFSGNLSSGATTASVTGVNVVDPAGGSHTLSLNFTTATLGSGNWTVDVLDGATTVGSGAIVFVGSSPVPGSSTVTVTYAPVGSAPFPITFDFSTGVTSFSSGTSSTLAMSSQNGVSTGALTKTSFDAGGALTLTYSNGRVIKGATLALVGFNSQDAVAAFGSNQFRAVDPSALTLGVALQGAFGRIKAGVVEASNVDLAQEFSDLVVMQRGYQSSSQVISTANEMIQQLFSMKSK